MSIERARRLRKNLTDAERRLWSKLRRRQLDGFRFRRQVPLGPYFVDFLCIEERLIIEVDGGQHAVEQAADAKRTAWLKGEGFRVVRFWNNDVLANADGVIEIILRARRG
jgi:very-short-patch-repair endonuclease